MRRGRDKFCEWPSSVDPGYACSTSGFELFHALIRRENESKCLPYAERRPHDRRGSIVSMKFEMAVFWLVIPKS